MLNVFKQEAICMNTITAPTLQGVKLNRLFLWYYQNIIQEKKSEVYLLQRAKISLGYKNKEQET